VADIITSISGLFTDLGLAVYVGVGVVVGGVAYLLGRLAKAGR
jgi:hypothetical protein